MKYPLFLSDFNKTWIFSTYFQKIPQYQIASKFVQWEPSCSMQTDRHEEANSRFSQFRECPLKWTFVSFTEKEPWNELKREGKSMLSEVVIVSMCRRFFASKWMDTKSRLVLGSVIHRVKNFLCDSTWHLQKWQKNLVRLVARRDREIIVFNGAPARNKIIAGKAKWKNVSETQDLAFKAFLFLENAPAHPH